MPRCVIHLRRGEAHTTAGAAARRSAVALSRREYARRHPHRESPRPALARGGPWGRHHGALWAAKTI